MSIAVTLTLSIYTVLATNVSPVKQVADIGEKVSIKCNSFHIPKWTKHGRPLPKHLLPLINPFVVEIHRVKKEDAGIYTCGGRNSHGNFYATSEVIVPSKLLKPLHIVCINGNVVWLLCLKYWP